MMEDTHDPPDRIWAGIAAGAAGALAAYEARSEGDGVPPRARILDVPLDRM